MLGLGTQDHCPAHLGFGVLIRALGAQRAALRKGKAPVRRGDRTIPKIIT